MTDDRDKEAAAAGEAAKGGERVVPPIGCPFCLAAIGAGEEVHRCPGCGAVYHAACWQENGGCGVYGCVQVPAVEGRGALEIPQAYWGQENKQCPSCGQQILAAAVRCRHCGATFPSARPQEASEFQARSATAARRPALQRQVVVLFVLSVLPFTAPAAALAGLIWRRNHDEELRGLPPLYGALSKIAVIAAVALTVALAVMTALYAVVRSG